MKDPTIAANVHAMRGEIAAAVKLVVEYISEQSVATNLNWRQTAGLPQFAEVMRAPRVQRAIEGWKAEEAGLREIVRTFLEDLHSAG